MRVNGDLVLSIGKISYEVTERKSSRFLRAGASPFLCSKKSDLVVTQKNFVYPYRLYVGASLKTQRSRFTGTDILKSPLHAA